MERDRRPLPVPEPRVLTEEEKIAANAQHFAEGIMLNARDLKAARETIRQLETGLAQAFKDIDDGRARERKLQIERDDARDHANNMGGTVRGMIAIGEDGLNGQAAFERRYGDGHSAPLVRGLEQMMEDEAPEGRDNLRPLLQRLSEQSRGDR